MLAIAIWFLIKQVNRSGGDRIVTSPSRDNLFQGEKAEVPAKNLNKLKKKEKKP